MRILVASRSDVASLNIRDHLLDTQQWTQAQEAFRDQPTHRRGDACLVEVSGPTIRDEDLGEELLVQFADATAVWFLSKHRAASGQPSLTVHPVGNWGPAEYGGRPQTLSPTPARDMGALLRRAKHHRDASDLEHQVTFEATHHGPLIQIPALFLEIGSDDPHYDNPVAGAVWAQAIHDVLDGQGFTEAPIAVGIGGGHYVPRLTDLALDGLLDFGHMMPNYGVDQDEDGALLEACLANTPGAQGIYLHKKGLKGPQRQRVKAHAEREGWAYVEPLDS